MRSRTSRKLARVQCVRCVDRFGCLTRRRSGRICQWRELTGDVRHPTRQADPRRNHEATCRADRRPRRAVRDRAHRARRPDVRRRGRLPGTARDDRGLHRDHHRDRGQRRHRLDRGRHRACMALGGNDLICVVGGDVSTGAGDDSVVSDRPGRRSPRSPSWSAATTPTSAGPGSSDVIVDEISVVPRRPSAARRGLMELYPTSTPGTGTVDFGASHGYLYAFGEKQAKVDLAAQTASVDGLLDVTTIGLRNATATGCKVRMKGNAENNVLDAYGHDIVLSGGGGRDKLGRVGNGFDLDLPKCGRYKSVLPRPGRPRPSVRPARRRRADRRARPRRRERRRRRRHLPRRGPQATASGRAGSGADRRRDARIGRVGGCSSLTAHAVHSTQRVKTSEASSPSVTPDASDPVGEGLQVGEHDQAAGGDAEHPGRQVARPARRRSGRRRRRRPSARAT